METLMPLFGWSALGAIMLLIAILLVIDAEITSRWTERRNAGYVGRHRFDALRVSEGSEPVAYVKLLVTRRTTECVRVSGDDVTTIAVA